MYTSQHNSKSKSACCAPNLQPLCRSNKGCGVENLHFDYSTIQKSLKKGCLQCALEYQEDFKQGGMQVSSVYQS